MTKDEKRQQIIDELKLIDEKNLCLEFATGVGKTRCSLEYVKSKNCVKVLVLVPKIVLIKNWREDIAKHNIEGLSIDIACYRSIEKYTDKNYDAIICDECHRLSEANRKILPKIKTNYRVFLSATVKVSFKYYLFESFRAKIITIDVHDAIEDEILPEPEIIRIPLVLGTVNNTETLIINPKCPNDFGKILSYKDRWTAKRNKLYRFTIKCTAAEKHQEMNDYISYLQARIEDNIDARVNDKNLAFRYRKVCLDLLKWLSSAREKYTSQILDTLKYYRTITFCNSIEQTEILGKNAIHSKLGKKKVEQLLNAFNEKKIKHITSVSILNEGVNLSDCRIGVFAFYNSGKTIQTQKFGRILRHAKPIIVLPYFKDTREEEIVNDMVEGYNEDKIHYCTLATLENLIQTIK